MDNTSSAYEKGNMKIIVLGDSGVGKTSIIEKFISDFEFPTSKPQPTCEKGKSGLCASKYQKKMQFSF